MNIINKLNRIHYYDGMILLVLILAIKCNVFHLISTKWLKTSIHEILISIPPVCVVFIKCFKLLRLIRASPFI